MLARAAKRVLFLLAVVVAALAAPAGASAQAPTLIAAHQLTKNVNEYVYDVQTGPGGYDHIHLHRVIAAGRKSGDRHSHRATPGVLLLHGDTWGFQPAFLDGAPTPARSLPVYLAEHGVDSWGVDLAWTLVPAGVTDLSFMQTWGLRHDIDGVEAALRAARTIRAATGSGDAKMTLLGWSRGGWIGYALLAEEAERPPAQRQVGAFIPADTYFKSDDPDIRQFWCGAVDYFRGELAAGRDASDNSVYSQAGQLALSDPDGISPITGAPYTNRQLALLIGASPSDGVVPAYHFVAGLFPDDDSSAVPYGLRYTSVNRFERFLAAGSLWEPNRLLLETSEITCDATPSLYDSKLRDITVPVLYVGAGGGFGSYGLYTLSLLGSRDIQHRIVSFRSASQRGLDFGHVDLWTAPIAEQKLWSRIHSWLRSHAPR